MKLVSTEQSLSMEVEPRVHANMAGLENFTLGAGNSEERAPSRASAKADAENLFKPAPVGAAGEDDDETD
jgi:hypothetical protein